MAANLNPKITAFEAQAAANGFLLDHMPDRYGAYEARLESNGRVWRLSVLLTYPFIGSIGEVGEIKVAASTGKILFHTPLDTVLENGRRLYEAHREEIEAAFIKQTATTAQAVPKISAIDAEAAASHFLFDHLPDRLTAGQPRFDSQANVWIVPVLLAYPRIGPVGQAGEIVISGQTKTVVTHTPVDEILKNARVVYDQQREKIEAVVL